MWPGMIVGKPPKVYGSANKLSSATGRKLPLENKATIKLSFVDYGLESFRMLTLM